MEINSNNITDIIETLFPQNELNKLNECSWDTFHFKVISSRPKCFINLSKMHGKMFAVFVFFKKKALSHVFPCAFCEIFKKSYSIEHLRSTASWGVFNNLSNIYDEGFWWKISAKSCKNEDFRKQSPSLIINRVLNMSPASKKCMKYFKYSSDKSSYYKWMFSPTVCGLLYAKTILYDVSDKKRS